MFVTQCLVFFKEIAKASWSGLEFLSILSYAVDFKLRNKIVTSHTRCHTWLILLNKRMNFGTYRTTLGKKFGETRLNVYGLLNRNFWEMFGSFCLIRSHKFKQ